MGDQIVRNHLAPTLSIRRKLTAGSAVAPTPAIWVHQFAGGLRLPFDTKLTPSVDVACVMSDTCMSEDSWCPRRSAPTGDTGIGAIVCDGESERVERIGMERPAQRRAVQLDRRRLQRERYRRRRCGQDPSRHRQGSDENQAERSMPAPHRSMAARGGHCVSMSVVCTRNRSIGRRHRSICRTTWCYLKGLFVLLYQPHSTA